ncbi:GNAT family N-acetyltransferase [soil metagenome]
MIAPAPDLIDLRRIVGTRLPPPLAALASRALGITWFNKFYRQASSAAALEPDNFFEICVRHLGLDVRYDEAELLRIPQAGPVIVVANHPFGGADAVVLAALLTRLRPDTKLLANHLLATVPECAPSLIAVDPFGRDGAARRNLAPLRSALAHLKAGGLLGIFPAGEVSHLDPRTLTVRDRPWSDHAAALALRSSASVIPLHFEGRNSTAFQITGLIHPLVRTAQLCGELRRRTHRTIRLRIGRPIHPNKFPMDGGTPALTRLLRLRTDLLAESSRASRASRMQRTRSGQVIAPENLVPVACPEPADLLRAEVASLPPDALLAEQAGLRCFLTPAAPVPHLVREIGRLREITFRAVGEGTGTPLDLDPFDDHYLHLFLWDASACAVAGAYRLGPTDRILASHGPPGLYTGTLFEFKPGFLDQLGPAVELGRSFVTARYQKKIVALQLLWKGICTFIVRNPRYRVVFGPVSISQHYHALSKNLLVRFMREHLAHPALSKLVKAPHPPSRRRLHHLQMAEVSSSLRSIDDVSALISEIEGDGKGVPILLRHYVKMSAALLSFNVDHRFSGVIDGLMLADLCETDPRLLRRYMGTDGLSTFLAHHRVRA